MLSVCVKGSNLNWFLYLWQFSLLLILCFNSCLFKTHIVKWCNVNIDNTLSSPPSPILCQCSLHPTVLRLKHKTRVRDFIGDFKSRGRSGHDERFEQDPGILGDFMTSTQHEWIAHKWCVVLRVSMQDGGSNQQSHTDSQQLSHGKWLRWNSETNPPLPQWTISIDTAMISDAATFRLQFEILNTHFPPEDRFAKYKNKVYVWVNCIN